MSVTIFALNKQHQDFLNLVRLPASVSGEEVGILLGISADSVAILVSCGFLKPLGRQLAKNAPRRFATVTIEALARDADQLSKMQHALSSYWRSRNKARRGVQQSAGPRRVGHTFLRDDANAA